MPLSLDDYRCKLITKIQSCSSQAEVKRFIDTAMKEVKDNKVNGHIIARFINKALLELEAFTPVDKDAQQWSNIKMARVYFNQIRTMSETTVS